jgi:hypothetical protein
MVTPFYCRVVNCWGTGKKRDLSRISVLDRECEIFGQGFENILKRKMANVI